MFIEFKELSKEAQERIVKMYGGKFKTDALLEVNPFIENQISNLTKGDK